MQSEGRGSARNGRAVSSQLHLEEFQETVDLLGAYGVDFQIDFEIVRGLDYYSGTVFEIYAEGLGAQRQICGGGTYELSSLFGGKETSSTGFGLGFDRIMEIARIKEERKPPVFLVYTPDVKADAARIAVSLRMSDPTVLKQGGAAQGRIRSGGEACGDRGQRGAGFRQADLERHVRGRAGEFDLRGDSRTAQPDLFICLNLVSGEEPTSISDGCFHQNSIKYKITK